MPHGAIPSAGASPGNMNMWGFASVPQPPVPGAPKADGSNNPSATLRSLYFQQTQGVSRGVAQGRTEERTLGKHSREFRS